MAAEGVVKPDPFEEWAAVLRGHPCLVADIQEVRAAIATSLDAHFPRHFHWPAYLPPTEADRFDAVARLAYEDAGRRQAWLHIVSRRERFVLTALGSLLNQGATHLAARYPRLHTKSPGVSPGANLLRPPIGPWSTTWRCSSAWACIGTSTALSGGTITRAYSPPGWRMPMANQPPGARKPTTFLR